MSKASHSAAASRPAKWPSPAEYCEAIQQPGQNLTDDELRRCRLTLNDQQMPLLFSGGFADVYRLEDPGSGTAWAVKCFTRGAAGLRERYQAISEHLMRVRLPFMVDFQYQPEGIRVGGVPYPIVKMRWIEGLNLNRFVAQAASQPRLLDQFLQLWIKLASRLDKAEIAHADLQHGNVVLVPKGDDGAMQLRLIDYDGMLVPALANLPSNELGHAAYQHPQRQRDGVYRREVDRFSHLAICCAVRCLRESGRSLWERYDNGENLLFKEADYLDPGGSSLMRDLWMLRDPDARSLVGRVVLASQRPLSQSPRLEEILDGDRFRPLSDPERAEVNALLDGHLKPMWSRGVGSSPSSSDTPVASRAVRPGSSPAAGTRGSAATPRVGGIRASAPSDSPSGNPPLHRTVGAAQPVPSPVSQPASDESSTAWQVLTPLLGACVLAVVGLGGVGLAVFQATRPAPETVATAKPAPTVPPAAGAPRTGSGQATGLPSAGPPVGANTPGTDKPPGNSANVTDDSTSESPSPLTLPPTPAPVPAPTPPPPDPDPVPAPPPTVSPQLVFERLQRIVDLPMAEASATTLNFPLGQIRGGASVPINLELLGGREVLDGDQRFAMVRVGDPPDAGWRIDHQSGAGDAGTPVADLKFDLEMLIFRWLPTAPQITGASTLRNCVLRFSVPGRIQTMVLRNPLRIEPLEPAFVKRASVKWDIPASPPGNRLVIEYTFANADVVVPGGGSIRVEKDRDSQTFPYDGGVASDDQQLLALRVDVVRSPSLQASAGWMFRAPGERNWSQFSAARFKSVRDSNLRLLQRLNNSADALAIQAANFPLNNVLQTRLDQLQNQIDTLTGFQETLNWIDDRGLDASQGAIHFRVFFRAENEVVELLSTAR